jgi:4,5-dihydroxyphthalate decarboxylase
MGKIRLTAALGDYDHVRDLLTGRIPVSGVDLTPLVLPTEEIFQRFFHHREWEVSEFSFAKYVALVGAGDRSMVGLPVFPSRVFRHGSAYVRSDSTLTRFEELRGLRVGIPEWAQTAAVYGRGALTHTYGVPLSEISWVQAGVNEAGLPGRGPLPARR